MERFTNKPLVAVGSCQVGEPVRFNGEHQRRNPHIEALKDHLELVSIYPEVGIGLGRPRKAIRLVEVEGELRARDSETQQRDSAEALQGHAGRQHEAPPDLCGYILVKEPPSCGLEPVLRCDTNGHRIAADQAGIYAGRLIEIDPLLPMEEDARLHDHGLRESFVSCVYLYSRWKHLNAEGLTFNRLVNFYADYKYAVMAHSVSIYKQLGPLLANGKQRALDELAAEVVALMVSAFRQVVTRGRQANVLQHIQGYLKRTLSAQEKRSLQQLIEHYRQGIVPLAAPMTLLKHYFEREPDPYIERQVFMRPSSNELALRNHLF